MKVLLFFKCGGKGRRIPHLWCNKLWCSKEDLQLLLRVVDTRHSKVNDLDLVSGFRETQDVLRLQVQVDDILGVHKRNAFYDLTDKALARLLCQVKVVADDTFEEFATVYSDVGVQ